MSGLLLYYHTARHLRPRQLLCRARRMVKKGYPGPGLVDRNLAVSLPALDPVLPSRKSLAGSTFTFLNEEHTFEGDIDWDFGGKGLLWSYNLNYFDLLRQPGLETERGLRLMRGFAVKESPGAGWDPYPTSLRLINWVQFLALHGVGDKTIESSIAAQADHLLVNIEYHLMGNHLFENGAALLYAGVFLGDEEMQVRGMAILAEEVGEQILSDGGHFERSPMYHAIILGRVLDCVNLLANNECGGEDLLTMLRERGGEMLGWLGQVRFSSGCIPQVNDTAEGIAPNSDALADYAGRVGVKERTVSLGESGYRMIRKGKYELFVDVGDIGPDYQSGHAHSDTFSFCLQRKGEPLIVDTGVSTYEKGPVRQWQRGTAAHNTVRVNGLDQSEVWASFRVARRAYVRDLAEVGNSISVRHTGYERIGVSCSRSFETGEEGVTIRDSVGGESKKFCEAFLHFHPEVPVKADGPVVQAGDLSITFRGADGVEVSEYDYAAGFNRTVPAKMVTARFNGELVTEIAL